MSNAATVSTPTRSAARDDALGRRVILFLCLGVVVLSLLLSLGSQREQVIVPWLNAPLPPLCSMKYLTGLDCPGCGLTRSFIACAHGRWREAFDFNRAGPLWFLAVALQIPYQTLQLALLARGKRTLSPGWWGQGLLYACLAALVLQWMARMTGWL
jgi:hypothetical protein